jgi:hypothetical protein
MLLLWAVPLGILIGYLRRGRLANLSRLTLRGAWLVLLALVIQLLIFPWGSARRPFVEFGTEYLHLASYALLVVFVLLNRQEWGILSMGIGMALNLIVIAANSGYMPTRPELLEAAGRAEAAARLQSLGVYANNICMNAQNNYCLRPDTPVPLWFLGDVFHAPPWVPFANVFSIGDLLLALGLIVFLQAKMRSPAPP